jgi:hypothetical protein
MSKQRFLVLSLECVLQQYVRSPNMPIIKQSVPATDVFVPRQSMLPLALDSLFYYTVLYVKSTSQCAASGGVVFYTVFRVRIGFNADLDPAF